MSRDPAATGVRAILLDVEGTTTPIAFVLDVLFPYARRHLRQYVDDATAAHFESLMDRNSKATELKALQGKIWDEGFRRGELVSDVFPDVPAAFARWRARGLQLGIFSSGSVLAQQLIFRHAPAGDLTKYLSWYFDTTTGAKNDVESYRRIAAAMEIPPNSIVFISDVTGELDAARTAGMQTRLAVRPGNASPTENHGFVVVPTFDALL